MWKTTTRRDWLKWSCLAAAVAMVGGVCTLRAADEVKPVTFEPISVPVRVHLVQSEHEPRLQTTLTDVDVRRIFEKVNKVWAQAGIRIEIESICSTHAVDNAAPSGVPVESWFRTVIPKERMLEHGINVFYVKDITPNGIWMGGIVLVKDTARLFEVPGGLDEPLPRVTAHELGHAFGLPHRQDVTNLMASGKTGFTLNEAEIQTARTTAAAKYGGR